MYSVELFYFVFVLVICPASDFYFILFFYHNWNSSKVNYFVPEVITNIVGIVLFYSITRWQYRSGWAAIIVLVVCLLCIIFYLLNLRKDAEKNVNTILISTKTTLYKILTYTVSKILTKWYFASLNKTHSTCIVL